MQRLASQVRSSYVALERPAAAFGSTQTLGPGEGTEVVMEIDTAKVDEAVLAVLYLTLHDRVVAWKNIDWEAMGRLHERV